MLFNDLLTKLIYLTKRNNIANSEIGNIINLDRQSMSGRAARNSKFKDLEIKQIENYFNVDLSSVTICDNSFNIQNDETIKEKSSTFTNRLIQLQNKNLLSDIEFAKLLEISKDEYIELKCGDRKPNFSILIALKQHFKISLDWLLFGE